MTVNPCPLNRTLNCQKPTSKGAFLHWRRQNPSLNCRLLTVVVPIFRRRLKRGASILVVILKMSKTWKSKNFKRKVVEESDEDPDGYDGEVEPVILWIKSLFILTFILEFVLFPYSHFASLIFPWTLNRPTSKGPGRTCKEARTTSFSSRCSSWQAASVRSKTCIPGSRNISNIVFRHWKRRKWVSLFTSQNLWSSSWWVRRNRSSIMTSKL